MRYWVLFAVCLTRRWSIPSPETARDLLVLVAVIGRAGQTIGFVFVQLGPNRIIMSLKIYRAKTKTLPSPFSAPYRLKRRSQSVNKA